MVNTLWSFGFILVLNSVHSKKSDPPNAENRVRCVGVAVYVSLYNTENIKQMTCTPRTQSIFADHSHGFFSCENQSIHIFPRLCFFLFIGTFMFFLRRKKKNTRKKHRDHPLTEWTLLNMQILYVPGQ